MKVLLLNGSPHKNGCTYTALSEIAKTLESENIESEILQTENSPIRDCVACGACKKTGKCVFGDDIVNVLIDKMNTSDAFIVGSPVFYSHPTGKVLSILDRAFFAGKQNFMYKPAAAITSCRRAGTVASFDVLNKYFTISNMPVVSSNYWNNVFGSKAEDVLQDQEGLQTMRVLAKNMAWLLKSIESGKKNGINISEQEEKIWTNFIR